MPQIPSKLDQYKGYGQPFGHMMDAINQLITYLHHRAELEDQRYKELTSRIDTIAGNQLEMKRGETWGELAKDLPTEQRIESKETGVNNRYTFIDPDKLDFMNTLFYYAVKPNERDNDQFIRTQTDGDIAVAINMFGPQSVDMQKLKEKFARSRNDNYNDWFADQTMTPPMLGGGLAAGQDVRQMMQPGNVGQQGGMNPASNVPPDQAALQ